MLNRILKRHIVLIIITILGFQSSLFGISDTVLATIKKQANEAPDSVIKITKSLIDNASYMLPNEMAEVYFFTAEAYFKLQDYAESEKYYKKALVLYSNQAIDYEGIINQQLGNINYNLGKLDSALEKYQVALKLFSVYNDTLNILKSFYKIGLVYNELDESRKAVHSFEEALQLYQMTGNKEDMADMLQNIGVSFLKQKNYDKALNFYQRALLIYEELGDNYKINATNIRIGEIYIKADDYYQAITSFEKAAGFFTDSTNYVQERISLMTHLGVVYLELNKNIKALEYLLLAAELAEKHSYIKNLVDIYINISLAYEKSEDFKNAHQYYKFYTEIYTGVLQEESIEQINELKNKYNLKVTERELQEKNDALKRQQRVKIILISNLSVLIAFALILITLLNRKESDRKKLEQYKQQLEKLVERRTAELRTEISERQVAEESDKLKSAFLANMSHEIRTPMNAIISFANFLKERDLTEEQREEYVSYINTSGQTLLRLIDDIIDTAKIEANQIKINKEPVHLNSLMIELLNIFRKSKLYEEKENVELILNPDNYKHNYIINTDKVRLKQVLTNLIENGFKYTHEGFVEFGFTTEIPQALKFYVKDTGPGIPKEKRHRVYDRFTRLSESKEKLYSGTGLGLSIAKEFISLLEGKIWFESQENLGTTFYFTLPYYQLEKVQSNIVSENIAPDDKGEILWKHKKILIAEDDDLNYRILETALKRKDAEVMRAPDGKVAVELSKSFLPDLILMDIQMPEMDGYEATRIIKKYNYKVPIIAQTSFAMSDDKEKCLEAGCDDYLSKPINMNELIQKINRFLKVV